MLLQVALSDEWRDPRTLLAVIGTIFGVLGVLFGLFRDRWSRRESRLDALAKILRPMICTVQLLKRANSNRKTIEQIKHSYPDPAKAPEAVKHANTLISAYGNEISESEKTFRNAEAELAACSFRFPDRIRKELKSLLECLSECGRLVNGGLFDKADIQVATFSDKYKVVTTTARGWRLADPLEFIRNRLRRTPETKVPKSEFELTQEEMNGVMELLHKRVTVESRNTFVVHPPKIIIDHPEILQANDVIDQLKDCVFTVVFQDGTAKMLSLPELVAFTFNLIMYIQQVQEVSAMFAAAKPDGPREMNATFTFSMQQLMQPEMVKALLEKIIFKYRQ